MPINDRLGEKIILITAYGLFGINMINLTRSEFISGWMAGTFTALIIEAIIF